MTTQTNPRDERRLLWDACLNVRDVGGYATGDGGKIRWRALLRSDSLCRLTAQGQAALVDHGIRTIVDLRSPSELALGPHPFASTSAGPYAPRYLSLPLFDGDDAAATTILEATTSTGAFYCRILDLFASRIGSIVGAVAEAPEGGVLVHCFAGKDRTGIVVGLLLATAGVPYETIAADYALSDSYLQPLYDQLLAATEDMFERERLASQLNALPETMLTTLAYLDEAYGGVAPYLRAVGVTDEHIERIRRRLRA